MRTGTVGQPSQTAGPATPLAARRRTQARVAVLTLATACAYVLYGLLRFRRFRAGTFDLVIFDQAVRGYAHFHAPASMARGVANGISANFSVLGDHWSPILAILAPLYWIHDDPTTLIVVQAVLFALAIPPLWIFSRRALSPAAAYFVCGAYAMSLPIAAAMNFDFHEVAFVPVLTAVMFERFQAGRRLGGALAALALLLVKEDMGLLVAGFGGYLFLVRQRGIGIGFIAGGLAATWVSTRVLIPAFGGSANFYWAYDQLGRNVSSAAWHAVTHPLQAFGLLITPRIKLWTMFLLVAPLGFAALASPMTVAAIPLLLERMLASGYPAWWTSSYHYNAFIVMVLFCAAVDGMSRIQRRLRTLGPKAGTGRSRACWPVSLRARWRFSWGVLWPAGRPARPRLILSRFPAASPGGMWAAAAFVATAALLLPQSPLGDLLRPHYYTTNKRSQAAAAAAAVVPSGTLVETTDYVGPRLSARDSVLLLDGTPRWAPWVVVDTTGKDFPFCSPAEQAGEAAFLEAHGYHKVFDRSGYVVLHRPGGIRADTQAELRHPAAAKRLRGNLCGPASAVAQPTSGG